jgi:hypothetical protein
VTITIAHATITGTHLEYLLNKFPRTKNCGLFSFPPKSPLVSLQVSVTGR